MRDRKIIFSVLGATLILLSYTFVVAQNNANPGFFTGAGKNPVSVDFKVQPHYKHRADGKPGREVILYFKGAKFEGKGSLEMQCSGKKEIIPIDGRGGIDSFSVLLPAGAGVKSDCDAKFILRGKNTELINTVSIPALRQWTVYIYPHSHVDIGYTNTQANVEIIHRRNLINAIQLAKKTAGYPKGARYLWNPEVLWPVERYLKIATPRQKQEIIEAVQKGYLHLDASYVNTNTSSMADEEMFEFFGQCLDMEKLTGTKIKTMVQVDVPGMSWGIVPVAANLGIKYIFAFNNGSDRVGRSTDMSFKPFWWLGPDGRSKVLFLQPGSYTPGERAKGHDYWPKMVGQTDPSKLIQVVKTDHPRQHFVDAYLAKMLPELEKSDYYPYDIFAMSWAMADNTPIDADLPDAVKSWNEEYAFPHLVISGATEIMETFEKKYGDQLPVLSGDFTEYWTDGLGTAAKQTAMNRNTREKLIQDETLWTMLHPAEAAPRVEVKEAWRNVSMGTEHTWCYMDPSKQPITDDILKVKFGYFRKAADLSQSVERAALSPVAQSNSATIGVFNTLSWAHGGLVRIPASQSEGFNSIEDPQGRSVVSQRLSTGELVFMATDVPPFGSKVYFLKDKKITYPGSMVHDNVLDNGIVRVVVDSQSGDISSLIYGAQEFVNARSAGTLNSYRYLHGDESPQKATGTFNVNISIKESGPLVASVLVRSEAEGCNSLVREITTVAGSPVIEIKNTIDKQAILKKEGVHFGFAFDIDDPVTRVDIPWGIMELDRDQLPGANRNWITFQRWLDISNDEKGITWCSLDAPVFESGNITANIIGGATNSEKWIKKLSPAATIYSWALNNHWHTNFPLSQEGKIVFRYRILPHNDAYDAASSNRFGLEQAQPLIVSTLKNDIPVKSLLSLTGDPKVFVSVIKTSDDGKTVQVRFRSVSDKDEPVRLHWSGGNPETVAVLDDTGTHIIEKQAANEIVVPAMGFKTLQAKLAPAQKK